MRDILRWILHWLSSEPVSEATPISATVYGPAATATLEGPAATGTLGD